MNQPKPVTLLKRYVTMVAALVLTISAVPARAQNFAPVTGLSGGAVSLVAADRNPTNPSVAVGINGLGLFTGSASVAKDGTTVVWTATNCDACAWARQAAWDDKGRLWVAASGYGLWRGTAGAAFTEVKLSGSNIVQSVSRGADGTMWAVLGNSVVQVSADDSVKVVGKNASLLGLDKLALPSSADGAVYAASAGEVYVLDKDSAWTPLKVPADPVVIAQLKGSLYAGTFKGVYQLNGNSWTALGPDKTKVTGMAVAANGVITIGTANAGTQYLLNGSWIGLGSTGFAEKRVLALASDANGTLYLGLKSGLNLAQGVGSTVASARPTLGTATALAAASDGLPSNDVRDVVTVGNDVYALIAGQGIFSRVGKSSRWLAVNDLLDDEPLQLIANETAAYTVTASGSIYRFAVPTSAAGAWVKIGSAGVLPRALAVGSKESLWLAGQGGVVLMRETPESKWVTASKGLERAGDISRLVALSSGTIYAGTTRGGVYQWDAAAKSWSAIDSVGLPVVNVRGGQGISPINALLYDNGTLYAGTNHGVFATATASKSDTGWKSVASGLPEPLVRSLAIDAKGTLVVGTINGAWAVSLSATTDKATWSEYASTKGDGVVALVRVGSEVIVATQSRPGKVGRVLAGG